MLSANHQSVTHPPHPHPHPHRILSLGAVQNNENERKTTGLVVNPHVICAFRLRQTCDQPGDATMVVIDQFTQNLIIWHSSGFQ